MCLPPEIARQKRLLLAPSFTAQRRNVTNTSAVCRFLNSPPNRITYKCYFAPYFRAFQGIENPLCGGKQIQERNQWFSDQWDDVGGASQEFSVVSEDGEDTDSTIPRERTGAFPVEIPYRLINMFTVYGDVVCDPFIGTGTTSLAAMLTGRHSIGIEIESGIAELLSDRVRGIVTESQERITERIAAHQEFVQDRADNGNPASYEASHYPFSVVTKQEKQVKFYEVVDCAAISESNCERFISLPDSSVPVGYRVTYKPYGEDIPVRLDRYS